MMLSPGAIERRRDVLDDGATSTASRTRRSTGPRSRCTTRRAGRRDHAHERLEERDELEDVGGRVRLHELAALVPASERRPLRPDRPETATLRGLIRAGGDLAARLGPPRRAADLIEQAEQELFEVTQQRARGTLIPAADAITRRLPPHRRARRERRATSSASRPASRRSTG
jgi:hypothetical protein